MALAVKVGLLAVAAGAFLAVYLTGGGAAGYVLAAVQALMTLAFVLLRAKWTLGVAGAAFAINCVLWYNPSWGSSSAEGVDCNFQNCYCCAGPNDTRFWDCRPDCGSGGGTRADDCGSKLVGSRTCTTY